MPQVNKELSRIFGTMADLLEIRGDRRDFYRVRAYRAASLALLSEAKDVTLMNQKELEGLSGIGKAISEKILEYGDSGKIAAFETLKKSLPRGISELLDIRGLGPKHVRQFWVELGITTLPKLKAALEKGVIAELPGFGERSAQKLSDAILNFSGSEKILFKKAFSVAKKVLASLGKMKCVSEACVAGSLRRGKKEVHDIDILVQSRKPQDCAKKIAQADFWERMIGQGETKVSGIAYKIQCDIRIVAPESFGAALVYFTGSKGFNIYLRKIAIAKNLKLNEYGLFDGKGKRVAGKTEKSVFKALGIAYLEPTDREAF